MNKNDLRKKYLRKRQSLTSEDYELLNQKIIHIVFEQFDFNQFNTVHTFLSIDKFNEVNTWAIIDRLQSQFPNLKIAVPKMAGDGLEHYEYKGNTHLITNSWGISEPINCPNINVEDIDCILVPLLAFDAIGHRIGYGKGYYDRFLTQATNAATIGLSLFPALEESISTDIHDVPMHHCVTPDNIYHFKAL